MANSFSRNLSSGRLQSQQKGIDTNSTRQSADGQNAEVLVENVFQSMLTLERRRAERSGNPFVLMLLDANSENGTAREILIHAANVVVKTKRETDLAGWYKQNAILGIIFTEVSLEGDLSITETLRSKIEKAFVQHLGRDRAAKIAISVHIFPERSDQRGTGWAEDPGLYVVHDKKVS